jgi:hypothetical protein
MKKSVWEADGYINRLITEKNFLVLMELIDF